MYRVIVDVNYGSGPQSFEFLETNEAEALRRAEEVARVGLWSGVSPDDIFIPPSAVVLVRVFSPKDEHVF
jgi:hypothetical protein